MRLKLTIILLTVLIAGQAAAISPFAPRGKGYNGIKMGIISRANIRVEDQELESDMDITIGLFWEVPVYKSFWSGVDIDLHNASVLDQQQFFLNVGVPIKYRRQTSRASAVTLIGITPGFGHLADIGFLERSNYFTLTGSFEIQIPQEKGRAWVLELAVFGSVVGGNSDYDVKFGPAYLLRLGYIL